jgi:hypothetical protein
MSDPKPLPWRFAVLFTVAAACSTPDRSTSGDGDEPPGANGETIAERQLLPVPWTDAFMKPAVLIAAEIRIEGPKGLFRHLATVSNAEELDRMEKTLPEGFLQETVVKAEAAGAEIKAQLDRLAIVATRRLSVLERPGQVDVVVVASGEAYWAGGEGNEKRGERLRFDGKIAR